VRLFGERSRGKETKVFFATDVHGSERTWRKFLAAARFYRADVLVMGGDVMGKLAIPLIRERNGHHRATIHGRVERLGELRQQHPSPQPRRKRPRVARARKRGQLTNRSVT